ncbi:MAG TPA: alkaline phosphatase D family protein, partial [Fimbriimonadaceae bacterium]|nr:alkaline phosphatase D family protein [Fimbriimonadaceae bacterium]
MTKRLILHILLLISIAVAQQHEVLNSGPMLAYSEMREVAVWVQTKRPARVQIRYWRKDTPGQPRDSAEIRTAEASDFIALFKLRELDMGQRYGYRLLIDGKEVRRDYPLEFQTQPHWRWASNPAQPPNFTALLGSCMYINDTPFDRPGQPYGGDYQIYGAMHKVGADFMVWLGDNIYYREMDWLTEDSMRYRWRHDRALAELQPLLASTHHYGTWDDHDFGPNDSDRSFRLRGQALRVFHDYFPAVQYGTPETPGVFQRFEWGDVEFFMLDDRYYRSPN